MQNNIIEFLRWLCNGLTRAPDSARQFHHRDSNMADLYIKNRNLKGLKGKRLEGVKYQKLRTD